MYLKKGESTILRVLWTPTKKGGMRETIHIKFPLGRLQMIVSGVARNPPWGMKQVKCEDKSTINAGFKEKRALVELKTELSSPEQFCMMTANNESEACTNENREEIPKEVFAESEKRNSNSERASSGWRNERALLNHCSSPQTATALTAELKFAYDPQWEAKQTATFTNWLNHLFQPTDVADQVDELQLKHLSDSSVFNRTAFRTLFTYQQRLIEWKAAAALFHSLEMKTIRRAIESEVEKGHFVMRSDRHILADVHVKEQLKTLLLSYSKKWLQLGLDMVIGTHRDQRQQVSVRILI